MTACHDMFFKNDILLGINVIYWYCIVFPSKQFIQSY